MPRSLQFSKMSNTFLNQTDFVKALSLCRLMYMLGQQETCISYMLKFTPFIIHTLGKGELKGIQIEDGPDQLVYIPNIYNI